MGRFKDCGSTARLSESLVDSKLELLTLAPFCVLGLMNYKVLVHLKEFDPPNLLFCLINSGILLRALVLTFYLLLIISYSRVLLIELDFISYFFLYIDMVLGPQLPPSDIRGDVPFLKMAEGESPSFNESFLI